MSLPKGRTNNLNGRPVGSTNKATRELRELIATYLDKNFPRIEKLIKQLEPRDQVKFYVELLSFGLPKLQSVNLEQPMPAMLPQVVIYPAPGYEPLKEEDDGRFHPDEN